MYSPLRVAGVLCADCLSFLQPELICLGWQARFSHRAWDLRLHVLSSADWSLGHSVLRVSLRNNFASIGSASALEASVTVLGSITKL